MNKDIEPGASIHFVYIDSKNKVVKFFIVLGKKLMEQRNWNRSHQISSVVWI